MFFCALLNHFICLTMNEQLQKFLEEQKKKTKQERDNHLGKLGLYDFEKCNKVYANPSWDKQTAITEGYIYKDEKGYFKIDGSKYVIQVSDEEYGEICKYCPVIEKNGFSEVLLDNVGSIRKMVKFFTILAVINLVVGLILFLKYLL